jgi:predicted aconitase with swiveling domain
LVRLTALIAGTATGPVVALTEPLSFWGGFEPGSGLIIDRRHPQLGVSLTGSIALIPSGRGSSSSSSVLAEAIRMGTAPAGIVLTTPDAIIMLGAMVAEELYGSTMPVVVIGETDVPTVRAWSSARIATDLTDADAEPAG